MKRSAIASSMIAAGIVSAIVAGGIRLYDPVVPNARASAPAVLNAAPMAPIAAQALPDFSSLVQAYGPAVVNISVTHGRKTDAAKPQTRGFSEDDPFFEFFRRFQIPMPQGEMPKQGLGSGFIVSRDGYVLTNAHVVRDADEVTVRLTDKREFKAKVIGTDPQTDLAVLKIEASELPTVKLGNSQDIKVGEWVVAIGSPFGFENSVTAGIVSAKGRALPDGTYVPFIQTDVAVNPGNSGGPLFNLKGEVIGINSQIYSRTGGYQGLSFAIPIDLATKIQDQLVRYGKVTRGRIGVTIQEMNQSLAESFGLKEPAGALVGSVDSSGPAARAGIEPGDVILKIDDKAVARSIDLSSYVADLKPGSTAKLEVWRKGAKRQMTVTVGEMPAKMAAAGSGPAVEQGKLGVAVRPLSESERKAAGVEGGVLVEQAGGAAARAGIRPGDIILALNSTPVKSADELRMMVDKTGKVAALLVQRQDAKIFIPVELG
ncbi:MAG TPA: DegQ family serine endoprotease [Burkholderiales bacterium]|nr:DegQ family serine endoprotease [Burkholderiales bacterium]